MLFSALLHSRARTLIITAKTEWLANILNLSTGTQQYYRRCINSFTSELAKKYISAITTASIQQYLTKFCWSHKASTANNHLVALKTFCRWLHETYNVPNAALLIKKLKTELPYQPFINHEQYLRVLESTTQKESDVIKILANTGLRASELANLRPENISPNLSSLRICGKGHKTRTIPCNQTVREILSRNINLPKNRKTIFNICHRAGSRASIHLAPHMLRRFFATSMLDAGTSLLVISRLLGHSSIMTTEIYLKLDSSYLTGVTDCLD